MTPPTRPRPRRSARPRPHRRVAALAAAVAVAVGTSLAAPGAALADGRGRGHAAPRHDVVQRTLERFVEEHGVPGALAAVTDRRGRERDLVAGVGDLTTGAPVPVDGQVRVGSNSKTFLAAVVLQLVGEGRIDLDASVETYLPGVVRGEGLDAGTITVRDLLQHTSGIGDYVAGPPFTDEAVQVTRLLELRDWYVEPHDLVTLGLSRPATPHGEFRYSNTNFLLAGLIVQKVTQRPLAETITERLIEPLGLADTYVPARGERTLRGEHPRGYHAEPAGGTLVDVSEIDTAASWAAGDIVSTPSDLNRFFSALVGGEVLRPAELTQMMTTVPMDMPGVPENLAYGLGIMSTVLSCGTVAWGHGGIIAGYQTEGAVTADGRAITFATTAMFAALAPQDGQAVTEASARLIDKVLCS